MLLTIYQIQYVSSFVLPFHNNKTICSINYGYIIKHNYVRCYSYQIRFIITCRGLKTNFHFNISKNVNIYSEKANSYITWTNFEGGYFYKQNITLISITLYSTTCINILHICTLFRIFGGKPSLLNQVHR